jgi:hypothetical protein
MSTSKYLYTLYFHFKLYYYLSHLATPQFMIYSSSYFITDLFHFSLYLLKYSATFCSLSLSFFIVAILLIPISVSIFVNRLSTSSSLQLLVSAHLSISYLLHIGHIPCSIFPLTTFNLQMPIFHHPIPLVASWVHISMYNYNKSLKSVTVVLFSYAVFLIK